jgi:hypothetical protein
VAVWLNLVRNSAFQGPGIVIAPIVSVLLAAFVIVSLTDGSTSTELSDEPSLFVDGIGNIVGPKPQDLNTVVDTYDANGFDHLEPFVSRLLSSPARHSALMIFTLDGSRGFSLRKRNGRLEVGLIVDSGKQPEREAAIRSFFEARYIEPTEDRPSGDDPILSSIRLLSYPVSGDTSEITKLAKQILEQLCYVAPEEGLQINVQHFR